MQFAVIVFLFLIRTKKTQYLFPTNKIAPYGVRAGARRVGKKHDWQDEAVAAQIAMKYDRYIWLINSKIEIFFSTKVREKEFPNALDIH